MHADPGYGKIAMLAMDRWVFHVEISWAFCAPSEISPRKSALILPA
jgi:hypothetical protein